MNPPRSIRRRVILLEGEVPIIDITHESGAARLHLDTEQNRLHIDDIDVDMTARRQGVGKQLLKAAKNLARDIEANEVTARIVSRECLDAMRHVFGHGAVDVRNEGSYDGTSQNENARHKRILTLSARH